MYWPLFNRLPFFFSLVELLAQNDLARCKVLFEAFGRRYYECNTSHFQATETPFRLALATILLNGELHAAAGARKPSLQVRFPFFFSKKERKQG